MSETYAVILDLVAHAGAVQPDRIVSRAFFKDAGLRGTLFAFDAGQELSEHTASAPAVIQILQGSADVTLGAERFELNAGAWLHMPAQLKHSVRAKTPLIMALFLFGAG